MSERVVPDATWSLPSPSRSSSAHIVPNSTLTTCNNIGHLDSCKSLFVADHITNDDTLSRFRVASPGTATVDSGSRGCLGEAGMKRRQGNFGDNIIRK